jgi:hypothetical protein
MLWRRKYPRLSTPFQIDYQLIDPEHFTQPPIRSVGLNISGEGICFETHALIDPNAMVALSIHFTAFHRPLLALARVAWCMQHGDAYAIGAEFFGVGWRDPAAHKALADYIPRQMPDATTS